MALLDDDADVDMVRASMRVRDGVRLRWEQMMWKK